MKLALPSAAVFKLSLIPLSSASSVKLAPAALPLILQLLYTIRVFSAFLFKLWLADVQWTCKVAKHYEMSFSRYASLRKRKAGLQSSKIKE